MRSWTRLLPLAALCYSAAAAAFPTEDDDLSPGELALAYGKKSAVWARVDAGAFDGKIITSPPDSTKFDRRLETLVDAGFDAPLGKSFGLRVNAEGDFVRQRQSEQDPPRATVDNTTTTATPSADLTYITEKGLEIFGGLMAQVSPTYDQTVASANGESQARYHEGMVQASRVGVVRRSGAWNGGFYYIAGAHAPQRVDQTAFDGTSSTSTNTVFIPSRVGVMGDFKAGGGVWDFELDFVQARGAGPTDDQGNTTLTDYIQAHAGYSYDFGGIGLKTAASYKALSYDRSSFITMDTIPAESFRLLAVFGGGDDYAFLGIIGGYGHDGQSLPEFNATYQFVAGAVSTGFHLSL